MTTDAKKTPTEIDETTLDDVSGGPHFRTWDSPGDAAKAEKDTVRFSSLSSSGWDNVKN